MEAMSEWRFLLFWNFNVVNVIFMEGNKFVFFKKKLHSRILFDKNKKSSRLKIMGNLIK